MSSTTTMRSLRSHLLLGALLQAGCDPVLFSAELDAPEICVSGYLFDFSPVGAHASAQTTMSADDLGLPDGDDLELDVAVLAITVRATDGVGDLGFLDNLTVRATPSDQGSGLPELMVVAMDRTDLADDGSLHSEPETPVEIADHLLASDVILTTEIAGQLPDVEWKSSMEVCVHAAARYRQPI